MEDPKNVKIVVIGHESAKTAIQTVKDSGHAVLIVEGPPEKEPQVHELEMCPLIELSAHDLPTKEELHKAKMDRIRKRRRK